MLDCGRGLLVGSQCLGGKTRRLMLLSTMMLLKSVEALAPRVRAGLDGPPESRWSPDDIKKVIDQAVIYCSVPAANHAMGQAAGILRGKRFLPHQETP